MTPLDQAVSAEYGAAAAVLSSTPSPYATSHPLADVVVDVGDGTTVTLLHKDVGAFLPGAEAARPAFLRDRRRERLVYEGLLPRVDVGSPRLVGAGEGWLLLEKVAGVELYQVDDLAVWRAVAGEVARMHRSFAALGATDEAEASFRLLRVDGPYLDRWMDRASAALAGAEPPWFGQLRGRYGQVRDRILSLPQAIVHGELYASNVLVSDATAPVRRVCPIDWEMAGVGAGLLDLAALVAGGWSEQERCAIAAGYLDELPQLAAADLDACRLHLAVQWLGWSPSWSPPPEHAHGWLAEAQQLCERLELI